MTSQTRPRNIIVAAIVALYRAGGMASGAVIEFEVAEAALSHRVGNAVSRSYNRTDLLDRRRPLMAAWADYVCGDADSNVVPMKRGVA